MENNDELLNALEEFSRSPGTGISNALEQYLCRVAATGVTVFSWCKLKPLLRHKLDIVLKEFHERSPVDCQTPCPNVDTVKFEEMHQHLLLTFDQLTGIPFTIQRICELVTNPTKHYKKTEKFMRGVEKNLMVVTTVDSFGNRIVCESKSLVNGLDASVEPDGLDRTTLDISSSTPVVDQSGTSPYVPPVPVNSPATASSSWFSSLSNVVDSPSSYPSWHCSSTGSPSSRLAGSPTSSRSKSDRPAWSLPIYDDDELEHGPPAKRPLLEDEKDVDSEEVPAHIICPLLGQLLSPSIEGNAQRSANDGDVGEDGDQAETTDLNGESSREPSENTEETTQPEEIDVPRTDSSLDLQTDSSNSSSDVSTADESQSAQDSSSDEMIASSDQNSVEPVSQDSLDDADVQNNASQGPQNVSLSSSSDSQLNTSFVASETSDTTLHDGSLDDSLQADDGVSTSEAASVTANQPLVVDSTENDLMLKSGAGDHCYKTAGCSESAGSASLGMLTSDVHMDTN